MKKLTKKERNQSDFKNKLKKSRRESHMIHLKGELSDDDHHHNLSAFAFLGTGFKGTELSDYKNPMNLS